MGAMARLGLAHRPWLPFWLTLCCLALPLSLQEKGGAANLAGLGAGGLAGDHAGGGAGAGAAAETAHRHRHQHWQQHQQQHRHTNLPKSKQEWIDNTLYSVERLQKLDTQIIIDGEIFQPRCSCLPPPPADSGNCFLNKIQIQPLPPFPGKLQKGRKILDGNNLRKLIGTKGGEEGEGEEGGGEKGEARRGRREEGGEKGEARLESGNSEREERARRETGKRKEERANPPSRL